MASKRKIRANKANARASTGPRTQAGKMRSARNARRHGLSLPILDDPEIAPVVQPLARQIAGADASPGLEELAREIVIAQLDLVRARQARHQLLLPAFCPPNTDESSDSDLAVVQNLDIAARIAEISTLVPLLIKLDRYERRAFSRRKSAIRKYDAVRAARIDNSNRV